MADAPVTTLELFRLRQNEELQRDLRELLDEFATSLSATLNLAAGLDIFCHGANRLFGADRTSVWIHDRRARQLVAPGVVRSRAGRRAACQVERGRRAGAGGAGACGARARRSSPAPDDASAEHP